MENEIYETLTVEISQQNRNNMEKKKIQTGQTYKGQINEALKKHFQL